MKKLLTIGFLLLAASAQAQNESTTQMSLANSAKFKTRLQYIAGQIARTVLAETPPAQCSVQRINLAQVTVSNSAGVANQISPIIVGGVNLVGTVISNADPNLVDSSATDAAILSQVSTFWNSLAGCYTGS